MRTSCVRALPVGLALLVTGCQVSSHELTPGAAPGAVAMVGDVAISAAELDSHVNPKLVRLRADEFGLKRRTLEERVRVLLLEREAARRGISVDDLVRTEIDLKAKLPQPHEIRSFFEAGRSRFKGTEAEGLAAVKQALTRQRIAARQVVFIRELWDRENVRILLDPPRVDLSLTPGPSRGAEDAAVTIVEFTNFQCPHCRRAADTLREVQERYGDRVRLVLKHFPTDALKDSMAAAEANVCAEEQGRVWQMKDTLFANAKALTPPDLQRYAAQVGLDMPKFNACLASGRARDRVNRDRAEGEAHGVSNTPTMFVNGRYLLGAIPFPALETIIEEELRRPGPRK